MRDHQSEDPLFMGQLVLDFPMDVKPNIDEMKFFKAFFTGVLKRRIVGGLRYGKIRKESRFMTRLKMEVDAYIKQGNMEQLLNIAVYAYLEAYAPENKKFHYDANVKSVTRGKVK